MNMIKIGVAGVITLALMGSFAHSQEKASDGGLLIPDDLTYTKNGNLEIEELRIGNRLDRLTVRHEKGLTEIYQVQNNDSIWASDETELGDVQNVRQWKLGTW